MHMKLPFLFVFQFSQPGLGLSSYFLAVLVCLPTQKKATANRGKKYPPFSSGQANIIISNDGQEYF